MTDTPTTDTEVSAERERLPFAAWLQDLRHGAAHAELTDALAELVSAVQTTGKAGELRLVVKVKPSDSGATQVIVSDDVVLKAPEPSRPISLFFVDEAHNLTRDDPFQQRLPLRDIPRPDKTDLREAK